MVTALKLTSLMAALLPALTSAMTLNINNWCGESVYLYESTCGRCNHGPSGVCDYNGGAPYALGPGNGGSVLRLNYDTSGCGTSIKIARGDSSFRSGILQYEYNVNWQGLWWDLSDLDGSGAGLVGTPFHNANVKVSPTGPGSGTGTCVQIRCPAGQVCLDSYQHPDDPNTKFCPLDTGDMWLDLCQPTPNFYHKKRDLSSIQARYPAPGNGTVVGGANSTAPAVPVATVAPGPALTGSNGIHRNHALNIPAPFRENEKVNTPNAEINIPTEEKRTVAFKA